MTIPESGIAIESPAALAAFIHELKQLMKAGELKQVPTPENLIEPTDILALLETGPWPDIIQAAFESRDGTRYELVVETYHGTGGAWKQL